jgi:hypothetical protein
VQPRGQHHRQLGLLQDHLGDPYAIGVERLAWLWHGPIGPPLPGDVPAAVPVPPAEETSTQRWDPVKPLLEVVVDR